MNAEIINFGDAARRGERDRVRARCVDAGVPLLRAIEAGHYQHAAAVLDNLKLDVLQAERRVIEIGGGETGRQYARRFLALALDALGGETAQGPEVLKEAAHWASQAVRALARLVETGFSDEQDRLEIIKRGKRIAAAAKASETRRRNRMKRAGDVELRGEKL